MRRLPASVLLLAPWLAAQDVSYDQGNYLARAEVQPVFAASQLEHPQFAPPTEGSALGEDTNGLLSRWKQEEYYDDLKYRPRFEVQFAFAAGRFDHHTDGSNLSDSTDGALFRFRFEGLTSSSVGGGFRFEGIGSDDDLFVEQGFAATEARSWTGYGHFTYRVEAGRFQMPARIGLLYNYYKLSEVVTDIDITYTSIGPYFELAPEILVFDRRNFAWSFYGEFGSGISLTWIDVATNADHFYSSTLITGVEAGTQFRAGVVQFGFAFCGRWQWMAESEQENGFVVLGYDNEFTGFLISGSAVF